MPIDPILGGTIINAAGTALSAWAGNAQNKRNVKYQQEQNRADRLHEANMYNVQRQHAQEDWARQNDYNHPLQQMERLRQAGLNPNLVYGKGAANTADAIRNVSPNASSQQAPEIDNSYLAAAGNQFLQNQQTIAQTDNLHAQQNLLVKEGYMKDLSITGKLIDNAKNKWDYELAKELKDYTVAQALFNAQKTQADMQYTREANRIQSERNYRFDRENWSNQLKLQREQIENIRSRTGTEKQRAMLIEEEVKLRKMGLNPSDPMYYRLIAKALEAKGIKLK